MAIVWSNIPSSTFFGWLLRAILRLIPYGTVVRVRSGINRGMRWVVGSSTHGCWLGSYEHEKQHALRRVVRLGMTVFDIGANAGFYTLAFSRLVGKQGHVWAFEPLAGKVEQLRQHIRLNRISNVGVIQAAVGDGPGMASLHVEEDGSMGSVVASGAYKVPLVSLDDLLADGVVPAPDVIKMDIEGSEAAALDGARMLLTKGRPTIFLAMHGEEQRTRCELLLRAAHYHIYYLDGREHRSGEPLSDDEIYALPFTPPTG